ncbi:MAG: hypothetical protein ABL927_06380 [Bdellovibrionales bacterium]
MTKKVHKKTTTVHEHPLHVPISKKNPTGITIRDRHLRRLKGTYLDAAEIAQITKKTLKILQDPDGEAKEFIFNGIRQKDLKDPNILIPMAVRWLHRKSKIAASKLKRSPSHEEIILEYKGLLKSNSDYKKAGLKKYREDYEKLKK